MMDPLYEIVKWSFRWTVFFSLISGKQWTNCQKNPKNLPMILPKSLIIDTQYYAYNLFSNGHLTSSIRKKCQYFCRRLHEIN